ncbi:hypothetical protein JCM10450v2_002611 [Rhodotorula kratochvilovae]
MTHSLLLRLCALASLASLAVASADVNTAVTADGERIIAGYTPSVGLSVAGIVLYGASTLALWWMWARTGRKLYMLTLNISMATMTLGFILRIVYNGDPASLGRYIVQYMFILLSPCAFLANNYLILSRLSQAMGPDGVHSLFLPAHRIGTIFIWSDVVTFLLQASGGGLTASSNASSTKLGKNIALAGLIIQLISYCLFTALLLVFGNNIRRRHAYLAHPAQPFKLGSYRFWAKDKVYDWRPLYWAVCLSCIGVIVRSFFRIVEYSEGYYGKLATGEGYFYTLDALPLWLAMSLYVFVFPARFIEGAREVHQAAGAQSALEAGGATAERYPVAGEKPEAYAMQQYK